MPTGKHEAGELSRQIADEVLSRAARLRLNRTQLAKLAEMAPTTLNPRLNGDKALTVDHVDRLAHALGISPYVLVQSAIEHAEASRREYELAGHTDTGDVDLKEQPEESSI